LRIVAGQQNNSTVPGLPLQQKSTVFVNIGQKRIDNLRLFEIIMMRNYGFIFIIAD